MHFSQSIEQVRNRVQEACQRSGRSPEEVKLIAVSKKQSIESIRAAYSLGLHDFGENYAQELRDKSSVLSENLGLKDELSAPRFSEALSIKWHFLGPLQRNKVRYVVGTACLIHSVDRLSLLEAITEQVRKKNHSPQECLIEVNLGEESQKSGCSLQALPGLLDTFAHFGGDVRCLGLMCIPPMHTKAESSRPYFRVLRELLRKEQAIPRPYVNLRELSMGMSLDYEVAIEEGATMIRVGTALFGKRA